MNSVLKKKMRPKTIRDTIRRVSADKKKKTPDVDQFFGKVHFEMDGLTFQKKIRGEWK